MERYTLQLVLLLALAAATVSFAQQAPPPTDLWIADLVRDGELWHLDAPRNLTDRDGYDNQPAFTPDGAKLLYTSFRDGQTDAWEIDLETGDSRPVTSTPESEYSPTPVPGQPRISTVRVEADGAQRLWSFSYPAGDDPQLLAPQVTGVGYHAWLDGRVLAIFVLGEPFTLRLLDLASGTATVVAEGIGRCVLTAPGARAASYVAPEADGFAIWTVAAEGGDPRRLAPAPASENRDYAWMPDGTLVAAAGSRILVLHPGRDDTWRPIADLSAAGVDDITRLTVSPASDRLAFVAARRTPSLEAKP